MPTLNELGQKVKLKYPGTYDDLSDDDVGRKVQMKFPGSYDDFTEKKGKVGTFVENIKTNVPKILKEGVAKNKETIKEYDEGKRTALSTGFKVAGQSALSTGLEVPFEFAKQFVKAAAPDLYEGAKQKIMPIAEKGMNIYEKIVNTPIQTTKSKQTLKESYGAVQKAYPNLTGVLEGGVNTYLGLTGIEQFANLSRDFRKAAEHLVLSKEASTIKAGRDLVAAESKIKDIVAKEYRKIINPTAAELKKFEIKKGKDVDVLVKRIAEEAPSISKTPEGGIDTFEATEKMREKGGQMHNQMRPILQTNPNPQFDLNKLRREMFTKLDGEIKSASDLEKMKDNVDKLIDPEIKRFGTNLLNGEQFDQVKSGLWSKKFDIGNPTEKRVAGTMGHNAKTQIEKAYPNFPIAELNKTQGEYFSAADLLEGAYGKKIKGTFSSNLLGGATGAIAGSAVAAAASPLLGAGGAVAGGYIGAKVAGRINDWMRSPERLTEGFQVKKAGLTLPTQQDRVLQQGSEALSKQRFAPSRTLQLSAPKAGATAREISTIYLPGKGILAGQRALKTKPNLLAIQKVGIVKNAPPPTPGVLYRPPQKMLPSPNLEGAMTPRVIIPPAPTTYEAGVIKRSPVKAKPTGDKSGFELLDKMKKASMKATDELKKSTLSGQRENLRLDKNTTIKSLEDIVGKNATPETKIPVFRAGKADIQIGDQVTTIEANAEKYAGLRSDSKVYKTKVALKDLVKNEGLRTEFIYAPKKAEKVTEVFKNFPDLSTKILGKTGSGNRRRKLQIPRN